MPALAIHEQVATITPGSRARIARLVHEACITMRQQMDRDAKPRGRAAWPDYLYEREDYGNLPALGELRGLVPLWAATARHVDEADWVFIDCFGKWHNPRTAKNGLAPWQWKLLELRAWQVVYNWRGGWRMIAAQLEHRPGMPSFSHAWCRIEHERLIDVACLRAREEGRV